MPGSTALGPSGRFVRQGDQSARWTNTAWTSGTPGLFAVVIGVSSYPHLVGGSGPVAERPLDLPQLHVSAMTALDVLDWLVHEHQGPVPLAECWFLASPTEEERAEAATHRSAAAFHRVPGATFDACEVALTEWWVAMRKLPTTAAATSRSAFFFSGHGIEIHRDKQLLLPSDYLLPPAELHNRCLSTSNLVGALATLRLHEHVLYVDACRSGSDQLRKLVVDGTPILNEQAAGGMNPRAIVPVLYAAADGTKAFQPKKVDRRSLYGTALLEGLRGQAGIEVRTEAGISSIWLYQLQPMMKRRVAALAAEGSGGGKVVEQRVVVGGLVDELELTRLPQGSTLSTMAPTPPRPRRPSSGPRLPRGRSFDVALQGLGATPDGLTLERLLATSTVTTIREDRGVHGAREPLPLDNAGRSGDASRWTVTIRPDGAGIASWLRVDDGQGGGFAVALPVDGHWYEQRSHGRVWSTVRYQVTLESDASGVADPEVTGLAVEAIEEDHATGLRDALDAHEVAVAEGVGLANTTLDERVLRAVVQDKIGSPLGALIAGDLLLQLQSNHLPGTWLENLTNWFPGWPDPPILLAEHALRADDDGLWQYALSRISRYGLPFLGGNVARLDRQLQIATSRRGGRRYGGVRDLLDRALPHYLPGGLLARWRFAEPPPGPEFLLPPA